MIKKFCIWYLRITETPVFLNLETVDGDIKLAAKKGPVFLSANTGPYGVHLNYKSKSKVRKYD
ncbi:MAG: hypothetical protein ACLRKY_03590 [Enterococcus gallinarum]|uniref:hypothetical protein n=1 Tax=Enterococcus gallinarum TaxID=1353 RepID=UPI00189AE384|nr:hypothetical protein [Enterococcus gallinarum]